jgi:urease accessory protein
MDGFARAGFAAKDGVTRLSDLDQRSPLRVLFPRVEGGEVPLAAFTTVSGGLVGGDSLRMEFAVEERAKAMAIGQAAEKVYRSAGPDSVVDVTLDAAAGAWLEWLPQETILFDGARLVRRTKVEVDGQGRLMAGECIVFGRLARGEVMRRGLVRDRWEVRQGGRLVWADALRIEDDIAGTLDAAAGFGGARAYATAIYVGADAAEFLDAAKDMAAGADGVRAGATCVGGVLVARWLSEDPLALRRAFEAYWMALRGAAGGLPAKLPRLWYV